MNNATKFEIKIKLRNDNVYDIYLNGKWMSSRGSYDNVLDELKNIIQYIENETGIYNG